MIPRTLREIITVSRKAVKDFKRTLEDLGELLREGERVPVRIPVQRGNNRPNFPFPRRQLGNRQFSTSVRRSVQPSFQLRLLQSTYRGGKPQMTNTFRNVIYQVQPFKIGSRVSLRGGVGKNMYNYFQQHNSRMFSTFGSATSATQAAQNLSQGIRSFILKGGELSINCSKTKIHVGSMNTNEVFANEDISMAGRVSNDEFVHEFGSFVEFNVNSTSVEDLLPRAGVFDEELSNDFGERMYLILDYQRKVLADIGLFTDKIGSTSFRCLNGKLRFYCPSCDVNKMETLLIENGIKTGLVYQMENLNNFKSEDSLNSVIQRSDSILSSSYGSVLSSNSSISSFDIDSSYIGESILSESDNYFEQARGIVV